MNGSSEKLAFWLMPTAEPKSFFVRLIGDLAQRLEAPVFEPHVTLHGGELDRDEAMKLLEQVASSSAALELQINGIDLSEKYTKTLYVQFRSSAEASAISDAIAQGSESSGGYEFDPHLSLLYKTMAQTQKEELARDIQIPFATVAFDAVALVSVPAAIKTGADVHAWQMLAERPLVGRSA